MEKESVYWHVSNKYYEADLQMCFGRYPDYKGAPAMVLLVRDGAVGPCALIQSLSQHRQTLQEIDKTGFDFDVSIVIGLFSSGQETEFGELDELYAQQGWEYLRFSAGSDQLLEERLRDAFMAHTWDGLKLRHNEKIGDAFHGLDDGDYGEFVQASTETPDAQENRTLLTTMGLTDTVESENHPMIFDRLRLEMERVKVLPVGPEKERRAALLAMAIEQIIQPTEMP